MMLLGIRVDRAARNDYSTDDSTFSDGGAFIPFSFAHTGSCQLTDARVALARSTLWKPIS